MNNYDVLKLYNHNIKAYENVKEKFEKDNVASIVHATGTGKSYIALQLALDNIDKNIYYIVPNNSIIEHIEEILKNSNLSLKDFPNLYFKTYQGLIRLNSDEIRNIDLDYLVLDEFHHIGAPVWGAKVMELVKTHPDIKIFGITAYTVRDRNTPFERDMVNEETEELFSNTVVSKYDLCDAMIDGVLPKPIYKSAYVNLAELYDGIVTNVEKLNHDSKEYKEYQTILKDLKKRIHEAPSVKDIFKQNIKTNGKYIYFCPTNSETGRNDIYAIRKEVKTWLEEMGLQENDYEIYITTSDMKNYGKQNREAFYNDLDLDGNKVDNKLRIMFAINQYNEGVHAPGLDGVIMGRETKSDIVYFEQLGRALSVAHNTKEEYDYLIKLSKEEIIKQHPNIKIDLNLTKEEIIDKLLSPVILDLTNNISYIKELEDNLKARVKEIRENKEYESRIIHLGNTSFDIDLLNNDLFNTLTELQERLRTSWMDKYNLLKKYYEYHGNCNVFFSFITKDGYTYDKDGIKLGHWLRNQKVMNLKGKLDKEKRELLEAIGVNLELKIHRNRWEDIYELAKKYYEFHGDLLVPQDFITKDGYTYDKDGIKLGDWLKRQKYKYRNGELDDTRKNLLNEIKIVWELKTLQQRWQDNYELAKKYYEHYGNLLIPNDFRTTNGIDYDENGVDLAHWIGHQKEFYANNRLTDDRKKLLNEIGIVWEYKNKKETWQHNYELAKKYFDHYGCLRMPKSFRTTNGIDYDEKGISLTSWLRNQVKYYHRDSLSEERIALLEKLNIRWVTNGSIKSWLKKYELAKKYYEHYGESSIPNNFKTKDGYTYDENGINIGSWLYSQKYKYAEKKLSNDQIKLLNEINMNWKIKNSEEAWQEKYELLRKYYEHYGTTEVKANFQTINGIDYDENGFPLAEWVHRQRTLYHASKLSEDHIKLLNELNFRFEKINKSEMLKLQEQWNRKYELAKKYYEFHGDLLVPQDFITNDGYTYDEDGIKLGDWLRRQKYKYINGDLSEIRKNLLDEIKIIWELETSEKRWQCNYELAKKYYEYYSNLSIRKYFKTTNGIDHNNEGFCLGKWIDHQKSIYNGFKNTFDMKQIKLLEDIGIEWNSKVKDLERQEEIIDENNLLRKQKEILHRCYSVLNQYDLEKLPDKEDLNDAFVKKLNRHI